jgi:hypothetical protein
VWGVQIVIYYAVNKTYGEAWSSPASYLQLFGFVLLVTGKDGKMIRCVESECFYCCILFLLVKLNCLSICFFILLSCLLLFSFLGTLIYNKSIDIPCFMCCDWLLALRERRAVRLEAQAMIYS